MSDLEVQHNRAKIGEVGNHDRKDKEFQLVTIKNI